MPLFHVYKELKAVAICLLKFSPTVRIIHCLLSLLGLSYISLPTSLIAKTNTERLTKLLEKLVLEHKETFDPDNIRDFVDACLQVRRDVTLRCLLAYYILRQFAGWNSPVVKCTSCAISLVSSNYRCSSTARWRSMAHVTWHTFV